MVITGEGSAIDGEGVVRTVEQERSPVHTASHTGAMLRLAQIAAALGDPRWRSQLDDVPHAVEVALGSGGEVEARLGRLAPRPVTHLLGGRPAPPTAYHGAPQL